MRTKPRAHPETHFLVESRKMRSESVAMEGDITVVTLTSSGALAALRMRAADENGVLE